MNRKFGIRGYIRERPRRGRKDKRNREGCKVQGVDAHIAHKQDRVGLSSENKLGRASHSSDKDGTGQNAKCSVVGSNCASGMRSVGATIGKSSLRAARRGRGRCQRHARAGEWW